MKRSGQSGLRLGLAASTLALAANIHCSPDVIVGRDHDVRDASADTLGTTAAGEGSERGPDQTSLRSVRRLASGAHVGAGWTTCPAPTDPSCDGWIATTPGALVEEGRVAAAGTDLIRSLTLLGDDRILAGMRTPRGTGSAWLGRRTPSELVWETSLTSDPEKPSDARAVELAPDGTLVVGGNERLDAFETGWVARVAADGALVKRVRLDGTPSSSEATVDSIAVLTGSRNMVYVGGQRRETVNGTTRSVPIVVELDPDLVLFNSKSGIGIDGVQSGTVKTLLTERATEVTACAQVDDGVGVVRMRDYLSDVIETRTITEPGLRIVFAGCTVTDDGAILLAGTVVRSDVPRPWAAKIDRVTLAPAWTRIYENEVGRLEAVAPAVGNGGLAVGTSGTHAYFLAIAP